jgi:phosphoglycerate dehydrogenase-like enzyme
VHGRTLPPELATCELRFPAEADPFAGVSRADAVVLGWGAPPLAVNGGVSLERLRLAIVLGASVKWALPAELLEPGRVSICNTADAIAQSVAEHRLLLTLAGLRRLSGGGRCHARRGLASRAGRQASVRKRSCRERPGCPWSPSSGPA